MNNDHTLVQDNGQVVYRILFLQQCVSSMIVEKEMQLPPTLFVLSTISLFSLYYTYILREFLI